MTQGPPRFVGDKTALMLEVEQAVREKEAREAEVARERQATVAAVWAKYDGLPASERTREALSSTFQEAERQTYDLAPQHEREIRKVNRIALRRRFPLPDGARVDGDEAEILVFALPAEPCAKMVEQALARRDWVEALSKIGFKQLQCPGNAPPRASAAAGKAARVTWEVSETPRDLERAGP